MSKSYRNDAKNEKWRREKQRKNNPSQQWRKPERDKPDKYSPFDDSIEHHEQFA